MSGLGFDDFLAPFLAILGRRGVKRIYFRLSEVPDAEGKQQPLGIFGTVESSRRNQRFAGQGCVDGGCGAAGVHVGQHSRTVTIGD